MHCCYREQNKTQKFLEKEHFSSSEYYGRLPLPQSGGPSPELIQPLATWGEAWEAIPDVSEWVLKTIKRGYLLQFARKPTRFRGMVSTSVRSNVAHVLRSEVMSLLAKGSVETVSPPHSE